MKLISFRHQDRDSYGEVRGDQVLELATPSVPTLKAALIAGAIPSAAADAASFALAEVRLLPVVPDPGKIICVGVNYVEHRDETGRSASAYPTIFTRWADTQVPHGAPMIRPRASTNFDFEGELAVIIGKGGRRIAEADALAHVAGYACYNDGSIRDWQGHSQQFTPGKNFPGTGGFGPWMVTPDEIADLDAVALTTRLNGEIVQHATVSQMIFSIPQVIAYVSAFTTLSPGDVISTGTPGGVGAKRKPPLWMKAGDVVEVDIEGVGVLRNPIVDEA